MVQELNHLSDSRLTLVFFFRIVALLTVILFADCNNNLLIYGFAL